MTITPQGKQRLNRVLGTKKTTQLQAALEEKKLPVGIEIFQAKTLWPWHSLYAAPPNSWAPRKHVMYRVTPTGPLRTTTQPIERAQVAGFGIQAGAIAQAITDDGVLMNELEEYRHLPRGGVWFDP